MLHNRHKLLLWRIVNGILPTKAKLNSIFHSNDLNCCLRDSSVESVDHIFINCHFVHQAWFISSWNFRMDNFVDMRIKDWIFLIFDSSNSLFCSNLRREEFIVYIAVLFDLT